MHELMAPHISLLVSPHISHIPHRHTLSDKQNNRFSTFKSGEGAFFTVTLPTSGLYTPQMKDENNSHYVGEVMCALHNMTSGVGVGLG